MINFYVLDIKYKINIATKYEFQIKLIRHVCKIIIFATIKIILKLRNSVEQNKIKIQSLVSIEKIKLNFSEEI